MKPSIIYKIKAIFNNTDLQIKVFEDSEVRFSLHLEWAGIFTQTVGLFLSNFILIFLGTALFWFGLYKYITNISRVYDEWTEEKEKKEKEKIYDFNT